MAKHSSDRARTRNGKCGEKMKIETGFKGKAVGLFPNNIGGWTAYVFKERIIGTRDECLQWLKNRKPKGEK